MYNEEYLNALDLLKNDLGIIHTKRDEYYYALLHSVNKELSERGIHLDMENIEDQMLLSDYAAWKYRNREKNVELAKNLKIRIMNRKVKGRAEGHVEG